MDIARISYNTVKFQGKTDLGNTGLTYNVKITAEEFAKKGVRCLSSLGD